MNVGVLCCDRRMSQIADNLSSDMDVIYVDESTDFLSLPMLDILVLPVKGIDVYGYVEFTQKRVHIPSTFWNMQGKHLQIFCGLPCEALRDKNVYYYMNDEEVVKANAILTAEGVLYELIASVCKSIYAIQVDIIGYGFCGKEIYKMFKNLHVPVRVIRRDCESNDTFVKLSEWNTCGDVIINTAPVNVIEETHLQSWNKQVVLLDIASGSIFDQHVLKQHQIVYKKLPNLPGRYAHISAGNIIADCIRGICHGK